MVGHPLELRPRVPSRIDEALRQVRRSQDKVDALFVRRRCRTSVLREEIDQSCVQEGLHHTVVNPGRRPGFGRGRGGHHCRACVSKGRCCRRGRHGLLERKR